MWLDDVSGGAINHVSIVLPIGWKEVCAEQHQQSREAFVFAKRNVDILMWIVK